MRFSFLGFPVSRFGTVRFGLRGLGLLGYAMRRYVCKGLDWSVAVACKVYYYHWNWGTRDWNERMGLGTGFDC